MAVVEVTFEDEFADGAVLVIEKQFWNHDTVYSYAAIKEGGKWYITGNTGRQVRGYTTDDLIAWLLRGWDPDHPPRIYWAPQVVELEVPE